MKRNPVIPFAIIAVLGILTMIVLSIVGLDQQDQIAQEDGTGGEEEVIQDPEVLIESCISCHGSDLGGNNGPSLQNVGSDYSVDEIQDIIINGKGTGMPGGLVSNEEAAILAEWLAEKK
ncbi:cytochrome c [Aquibacillus koreensis]|uniref:Cytochrome c n=1 Tax=Aquibacillus koreensis TaxID=279446 RepID=A0A9X4AGG1_9BACI|nr:cytochrome c [Aquibacillus koreensis]MCT2537586.1 cytochrome c [Aquibacillus koreensis]MDC3419032.1 cytochrome c [Aquibacillus koreensis]